MDTQKLVSEKPELWVFRKDLPMSQLLEKFLFLSQLRKVQP
jgi:hypothetical protein